MMKRFSLVCASLLFVACGTSTENSQLSSDQDTEQASFPVGPNSEMTPGEKCQNPDAYRYAEKIAYCNRDVSTSTKNGVIAEYDRKFGFQVGRMNRQDFKIDHYIPLCMGGSNSTKNLWPQHKSVFAKTDPLEQRLCEFMAAGTMTQAVAMEKIRFAKNNLDQAGELAREVDALLGH